MKKSDKIFIGIVFALILCGVCLLLTACGAGSVTSEAGVKLTAQEISGQEDATFDASFDTSLFDHAGKFKVKINTQSGTKTYTVKIVDTTAPSCTVKRAYFGVGSKVPDPSCFIDEIFEADDYTVEYIEKPSGFTELGDYPAKFRITDASGNKSEVYDAVLTLIYDTEPPVISGAADLVVYSGDAVAYRSNITLSDNCAGEIKLDVDSSAVNTSFSGTYPVIYTATDAAGNRSTVTVKVHVYANKITLDTLNQKIDGILNGIITKNMSKEECCRAIYNYVVNSIQYVGTSDKTDWISAAYEALFVSGCGDCYSYFSAAKAMLTRLGIESIDIQRAAGYGEGTHYWCLVNIGTESSPEWYHFDCTRLTAKYNVSGCLLTDAQVKAYDKWRAGSYFRAYDISKFPKSSTKIITEIPELKAYMG